MPVLAGQAGLGIEKLDVLGASVFAEFRRLVPPGPEP